MYKNLEAQELLLLCILGESWETVFDDVIAFYKEDLDSDGLRLHLRIPSSTPGNKEGVCIGEIRNTCKASLPVNLC